ncbi:MAG: pyridoxal 5'-phosphate synthase glutaminase subunit PdxT [Terriglobales bacterium]
MSARRAGVLALQGDFAAHAAALARVGVEAVEVRRSADLAGLDGLVLPGGESTTMLKFLAQDGLGEAVRELVQRRPALATCAGAILLARRVRSPEQASLGLLDITAVRNAYGRQRESSIQTAKVEPGFIAQLHAEELEAVLIRAPQFEELGASVRVVARAGARPVLVRQEHILAAAFHPELSAYSPLHAWFANLLQSA